MIVVSETTLVVSLEPQSTNIFICEYTVSQEQLQFIQKNFTITQNHVDNVKGLAWPKLLSGLLLE